MGKRNSKTFILGLDELRSIEKGEEKNYLITNDKGGYSSLTTIGSVARRDHALFISGKTPPNYRIHMVTSLFDKIDDTPLYSQSFVTRTQNVFSGNLLTSFSFQYYPSYSYKVADLEIIKDIVYVHDENTVCVRYKVYNNEKKNHTLIVSPLYRLTPKDTLPGTSDLIVSDEKSVTNKTFDNTLYFITNGKTSIDDAPYFYNDLFFEYDSRDGRESVGRSFKINSFSFNIKDKEECFYILFSDKELNINTSIDEYASSLFTNEVKRCEDLITKSKLKNETAQSLVLSCDKYIVERRSTKGKTIIAGFPFFGDWGRDTMIALVGCTLTTKRYEECKSILRTFASYEKKGMMPNVFPEKESEEPLYNTVDASLLFINSVYLYFEKTKDISFVNEMLPVMKSIIENYKKGTLYHIKMDSDYLITSGEGLEQLTWMDVRFGDILPTPRQGKCVEINAYWYNALMILYTFTKEEKYRNMAENNVKPSFLSTFWDKEKGYLKDVISKDEKNRSSDSQIRPNMVWALTLPFTMIDKEKAQKILNVIYSHLYTPWGLRSLSNKDKHFHPTYGGSHFNRDMAYHQGTVWMYPLGAYYLAVLRFLENGKETVKRQLKATETALNEGCLGQLAEIYDGENPNKTQGCFAQAWSVSEILRVYEKIEEE